MSTENWTVDRLKIEVEKKLSGLLGKEWTPLCSINALVDELGGRLAPSVPPAGGEVAVFEPHGWAQTHGPEINAFTQEFDIAESWSISGYGTVELLNRNHVDDEIDRLRGEHQANLSRLQADNAELRDLVSKRLIDLTNMRHQHDTLQSEMTKARELLIPEECPHMIVFDDADRENLLFSGAGARQAALKTWEQISTSWNAHLFVRVERNSRDDGYPSAQQPAPAAKDGE